MEGLFTQTGIIKPSIGQVRKTQTWSCADDLQNHTQARIGIMHPNNHSLGMSYIMYTITGNKRLRKFVKIQFKRRMNRELSYNAYDDVFCLRAHQLANVAPTRIGKKVN